MTGSPLIDEGQVVIRSVTRKSTVRGGVWAESSSSLPVSQGPSVALRAASLADPSSSVCQHYQMSVTPDTGVWLTISGATNSGVPYWLYWASPSVSSCAFPKSQILTCSSPSAPSHSSRFSGCRTRGKVWELSEEGRTLRGLASPGAVCSPPPPAPHLDIQV